MEEKEKFTTLLRKLAFEKIDCRRIINLKMVFLLEDKEARGKMLHFRVNIGRQGIE